MFSLPEGGSPLGFESKGFVSSLARAEPLRFARDTSPPPPTLLQPRRSPRPHLEVFFERLGDGDAQEVRMDQHAGLDEVRAVELLLGHFVLLEHRDCGVDFGGVANKRGKMEIP